MDPLATSSDVEDRLGRPLTETESLRVDALLADASANVRGVARQAFSVVADDAVMLRCLSGRVTLNQRPVTSVASVTDLDGNPLTWRRVNDSLWVECAPQFVTVTYTHGGDVPDRILAVVCSIVCRALGTDPAKPGGVTQQSIDGYSEMTGGGVTLTNTAAAGGLGMFPDERAICEGYRRTVATLATA